MFLKQKIQKLLRVGGESFDSLTPIQKKIIEDYSKPDTLDQERARQILDNLKNRPDYNLDKGSQEIIQIAEQTKALNNGSITRSTENSIKDIDKTIKLSKMEQLILDNLETGSVEQQKSAMESMQRLVDIKGGMSQRDKELVQIAQDVIKSRRARELKVAPQEVSKIQKSRKSEIETNTRSSTVENALLELMEQKKAAGQSIEQVQKLIQNEGRRNQM
jgi:hypothetical protein